MALEVTVVALRYHVLLLSVMVRYDEKIMHKDRNGLVVVAPKVSSK